MVHVQFLPVRLPLGNVYRGVIRLGASSSRSHYRLRAPSLSHAAEPRHPRRVSAVFFLDSVGSAVIASVRAVSVSSAITVYRVTVAFFPAVRIPAVPVSAFSTVSLFYSETSVSGFRVSGVS